MRSIGRRKSDKWRMLVGLVLGAVLVSYAFYTSGCGEGTVQAPTPVATPVPPPPPAPAVVSGPAPVPTPTPPSGPAFELWGTAGSTIHVKYTGEASRAEIETWYTSFENQKLPFAAKRDIVLKGDTFTRAFGGGCKQGDAAQVGSKEIGGIYFDKDGNPFKDDKSAASKAKVEACQFQCDPEAKESWIEDEKYSDGEWSSCSPNNQPPNYVTGASEEQCFKKKTRTWTSTNICTKQTRTRTAWVYDECECPCVEPEETPTIPGAYSWNGVILEGKCEKEVLPTILVSSVVQLNCHEVGTQKWTIDFTCQADGERVVDLCRNVACPPPPACYYKVSGPGGEVGHAIKCSIFGGTWLNFDGDVLDNHCKFNLPGISNDDFQLSPGQSAPGCLNKQD